MFLIYKKVNVFFNLKEVQVLSAKSKTKTKLIINTVLITCIIKQMIVIFLVKAYEISKNSNIDLFLNNLLFLSFHSTHAKESQMSCIKVHRAHKPSVL